MIRYAIVLGLVAAQGCPPSPAPPDANVGDAAPSTCAAACANLLSLGCHEGVAANCVSSCDYATSSRLTDLHAGCLAAAKSRAEARACGTVACP